MSAKDSSTPAEGHRLTVAIVGGGLVGCLQAIYMAKRTGVTVNLYEKRVDLRNAEFVSAGISVNLALSVRGLEALKEVGMDQVVLQNCIPMKGRMIHELDGRRWVYPYGTKNERIKSVERQTLNSLLLTEAERHENVNVHFDHKLTSCNFDNDELHFLHDKKKVVHKADLIFGCDGSHSVVRREMIKRTRIDFSQMYIPHGYVEICMPAKTTPEGKGFAMEKNYLHIWPRNEYMLIGLPNLDMSFTGTLFMPFDVFDQLKTRQDALRFFQTRFPDSIELFGQENLLSTFEKWNVEGLISVKCNPFHYKDKCVLMGDAAHAIVPFYGQGMNCGMEDCLIFMESFHQHPNNIEKASQEFSRRRTGDAHAICDLAMYNYVEMRSKVNSKMFLLRRRVDRLLHWLLPNTWIPLYTTVCFTRIPYQRCIDNKAWQDKIINRVLFTTTFGGVAFSLFTLHRIWGHHIPTQLSMVWK